MTIQTAIASENPSAQVTAMIVNAFVHEGEGGNPAGVVLDADTLTEAQMQAIATKTGLSETAFVSRSETAAFKLDFFTPNRRIAHCGHATVGTFSVLAALGRVGEGDSSKETVDGNRAIRIDRGAAYMEQLAPSYHGEGSWGGSGTHAADVLAALGLKTAARGGLVDPIVVATGNRFMLIEVADQDALAAIAPDQQRIEAISEDLDLIGFYVFARTPDAETMATTRMFAPRYGISEEAGTGMAAGPLACLLHDRLGVAERTVRIEQGRFMTPPSVSRLDVKLAVEDGRITGLMAGGYGKVMRDISITY